MGNCETCKEKKEMPENIPYIAHESAMARAERTARRLWITILVLIFMLVGTNAAWLWYESQFEYVETTTTSQEVWQDSDTGNNTFVGGDAWLDKE